MDIENWHRNTDTKHEGHEMKMKDSYINNTSLQPLILGHVHIHFSKNIKAKYKMHQHKICWRTSQLKT